MVEGGRQSDGLIVTSIYSDTLLRGKRGVEDSNPCHEFDSIFIEYYPDYNSTKSYAMES